MEEDKEVEVPGRRQVASGVHSAPPPASAAQDTRECPEGAIRPSTPAAMVAAVAGVIARAIASAVALAVVAVAGPPSTI